MVKLKNQIAIRIQLKAIHKSNDSFQYKLTAFKYDIEPGQDEKDEILSEQGIYLPENDKRAMGGMNY